jgi:hypothetical protein
MTPLLIKTISEGPVGNHSSIEWDGKAASRQQLVDRVQNDPDFPTTLIRLGRHLYMGPKPLTIGAPAWADLWGTHDSTREIATADQECPTETPVVDETPEVADPTL